MDDRLAANVGIDLSNQIFLRCCQNGFVFGCSFLLSHVNDARLGKEFHLVICVRRRA